MPIMSLETVTEAPVTKQARLLEAPTGEMRAWSGVLGPLLDARPRGSALSWTLASALVTPLAHVSNLSLDFQLYLYGVFHRSRTARMVHSVGLPAIVVAGLATLMRLHPLLGWGAAAALATFYVVQAMLNEALLLAPVMVALTALLSELAHLWATGAAGQGVMAQPWLWVVALSAGEALSHAAEPDVPPRASGSTNWVPIRAFFARGGARPTVKSVARQMPRAVLMFFAGIGNELTSAWRLLPIDVMRGLFMVGYQPERRADLRARRQQALASGNPAIDAVGIGGAGLRADDLQRDEPPVSHAVEGTA